MLANNTTKTFTLIEIGLLPSSLKGLRLPSCPMAGQS